MSIKKRVADWRLARKNNRRGWRQISTWVHEEDADELKGVFQKLAGAPISDQIDQPAEAALWLQEEHAECYRLITSEWKYRQRPVSRQYLGLLYQAEIDGPSYGMYSQYFPIGGRILSAARTWIELTPAEADEVSRLCSHSISTVLEMWLTDKGLVGKERDDTGVATTERYCGTGDTSGVNAYGDLRRRDHAKFIENEQKIVTKILDEIEASFQHPSDNPDVYYHKASFYSPSRCFVTTEEVDGKLYVGLGNIENGGTSTTNAFERIASFLLEERFSNVLPEDIVWFDCYSEYNKNNYIEFTRVEMELGSNRQYIEPNWFHGADVPSGLRTRMENNILRDGACMPENKESGT